VGVVGALEADVVDAQWAALGSLSFVCAVVVIEALDARVFDGDCAGEAAREGVIVAALVDGVLRVGLFPFRAERARDAGVVFADGRFRGAIPGAPALDARVAGEGVAGLAPGRLALAAGVIGGVAGHALVLLASGGARVGARAAVLVGAAGDAGVGVDGEASFAERGVAGAAEVVSIETLDAAFAGHVADGPRGVAVEVAFTLTLEAANDSAIDELGERAAGVARLAARVQSGE
jgi:hypothetical protein